MKNKKALFILIGIFAVCFIGTSVLFAIRGISAANKEREYFDVYRTKAEEYIRSDSEILDTYGDDVIVEFYNSVTYSKSGERGGFGRYIEAFVPDVPDTLDEFETQTKMIKFNIKINGNAYEIVFEKNIMGELAVSSLARVEQ